MHEYMDLFVCNGCIMDVGMHSTCPRIFVRMYVLDAINACGINFEWINVYVYNESNSC